MKAAAAISLSLPCAFAMSFAGAPAEWALYDARLPLRADAGWPEELVLVTIDAATVDAMGGWPLPARSLAALLDAAHVAGAETLVLDVFLGHVGSPEDEALLARSLSRTVTAATLDPDDGRPPSDAELRRELLPASAGPEVAPSRLSFPPETVASAVARLGHAGVAGDGFVRGSPPLVRVEGFEGALPSQALAAWIEHRRIDPREIEARAGAVRIGRATLALSGGEALLDVVPSGAEPREVSAADLLAGAVAPGTLAGALAIVHVDTPEDRHPSPLGEATAGGRLLAAAIRTIANGRAPVRFPAWAAIAIAASLAFAATRAPARLRMLACAMAEGAWIGAAFLLVPLADVFLPILPAVVVFAGALLGVALDRPPASGDAAISAGASASDVPDGRS